MSVQLTLDYSRKFFESFRKIDKLSMPVIGLLRNKQPFDELANFYFEIIRNMLPDGAVGNVLK
jgi:hypothetical protein